ncbi:MAG: flagellar motor stator protein MotA [Halothiobacillus sp. 24-54-40]|jgi:chemotaxis protein MotA|nr:flagellar motor stator protein MotA [Halothiobacillaceae bacterium]OYV46307.1 MAG: flagellar motor stator protein MotA [Halothiobacillus sp. 20-53-49]OYY40360.1 MAG: flagellar motor stator protein MotA [Halothiobacillus sp. 35-54-62]OYZ86265.1 MAG: flagellar motor stator protein MotA [Halothiobacillus sp. 24-54-40]OZA79780.1 MAG: flagellar motor stator protein MotA [Halothiobacillus sp. 39-53-45]HQS02718.1 flagellar motor stator protein MotA [Halothiobacillus sp.]
MTLIIGWLIISGAVIGGFLAAGGHAAVLFQPFEYLMILGAATGAFVAANSGKTIKATLGGFGTAIKGSKYNKALYMETLALLYNIFTRARKEGLMAIEEDIEDPQNSALFKEAPKVLADHHALEFITDYLRLMVSSTLDVHQIDNLMDIDIDTHHQEASLPGNNIAKMADAMPAFGIVAAVLGVVHVMESVSLPPAELGKLIAAALVGTFLGIFVSYGYISPVANNLEHKVNDSTKYYQSIKASMIAFMNGYPPQVAAEFGRKVLFSSERPGFQELEEFLKQKK